MQTNINTTSKMIPLTIIKQNSILDKITLLEQVSIQDVKNLIKSEQLHDHFNMDKYSEALASQLYNNEKHQLELYRDLYKQKLNCFAISYSKSKHKYGRTYPKNCMGLTAFRSKIRNTLIKDSYIDLDLSNAQPVIIYNICKSNNIPCDSVEHYVLNRKDVLTKLGAIYNVHTGIVKKLFIRLAFFGSFVEWQKENSIDLNIKIDSFIESFQSELYKIAKVVKLANPDLYETVSRSKKYKSNVMASFFAIYLQHREAEIIEIAMSYIINQTNIANHSKSDSKIMTYEYDGLKLLKIPSEAYGIDKLIKNLNYAVLDSLGYNIEFVQKPIDYFYVLENISEDNDLTFEAVKNAFEINHCKIINKAIYITETDKTVIMSESHLKVAYNHLNYIDVTPKGDVSKSFISKWISHDHPNIRRFDDMGVFPCESLCPKNIYNLWKPFAMENVTEYDEHLPALDFMLEHINILCNYQADVTNYIIAWIGQMIQFPHIKTICPTIISAEGSGKGSLVELISKMLGTSKVFITTMPSRDCWGAFNGSMTESFFVNLNELSKKETSGAQGIIKGLITDPTMIINNKGVNQFSVASYHRFFITTNKDEPIHTTKGDRRNLIIRSSDCKKGDTAYFDQMHKYLASTNVIKTCYQYFKNIPNLDKFHKIPLPSTECQEDLKELSISPLEKWVESVVCNNMFETELYLSSSESYELFKTWAKSSGVMDDSGTKYNISNVQFGVRLFNLKLNGIDKKRTKYGMGHLFNINKLKIYFKMEDVSINLFKTIEPE